MEILNGGGQADDEVHQRKTYNNETMILIIVLHYMHKLGFRQTMNT